MSPREDLVRRSVKLDEIERGQGAARELDEAAADGKRPQVDAEEAGARVDGAFDAARDAGPRGEAAVGEDIFVAAGVKEQREVAKRGGLSS